MLKELAEFYVGLKKKVTWNKYSLGQYCVWLQWFHFLKNLDWGSGGNNNVEWYDLLAEKNQKPNPLCSLLNSAKVKKRARLAVLGIKRVWWKLLFIIPVGNAHPGVGLGAGKAQLLLIARAERAEQGRSTPGCRIPAWCNTQRWFHTAPISCTSMLIAKVKF